MNQPKKKSLKEILLAMKFKAPGGKGDLAPIRVDADNVVTSDEDQNAADQKQIDADRLRAAVKFAPKRR